MTNAKSSSKTSNTFCILGSLFLLLIGAFHGTGFFYVSEAIEKSNAESFLKKIVPVLFAHPSIHLIGLSALGVLALFLKQDRGKLLWSLALLVLIDALLAFYLGGWIPGILLTVAALCFVFSGYKSNPQIALSPQAK
jgi:uncharacterized membrane protein